MQITINSQKKELKSHGNFSFPVHISQEKLSAYDGGSFHWHWHPEIELTIIQKGQIEYFVNDRSYILTEGHGLFANSNCLHYGRMIQDNDCEYLSVTFHPRFLYGYESSLIQTKYMDFIISNPQCSSLKLTKQDPGQQKILECLQQIQELSLHPDDTYELQLHLLLTKIWLILYRYFSSQPLTEAKNEDHLPRLKEILSFIHQNYSNPITLEDVADHVNICKSECCRFFKKHMKTTLFDYLLFYRIQQSLPLLRKEYNITKTAEMVGFSNPCYYGKIFKRYMNESPSSYRKRHFEKQAKETPSSMV